MENTLVEVSAEQTTNGTKVILALRPYESIVYVTDRFDGMDKKRVPQFGDKRVLDGEWKLSIATAKEYPTFHAECTLSELHNIGKIWPDFSGFMRYEKQVDLSGGIRSFAVLTIEEAYEGVEVWVNGENAGMKICPPYVFDITGLLKTGANTIRIEVANTLYRQVNAQYKIPNYFGPRIIVMEPSGIVGKVILSNR